MSKSKFRIEGRFDGANGATVTINRDGVPLFAVRPLRRKREYTLPLKDVAEMVLWRIVKAEAGVDLKPRKKRGL